LIEAPGDATSAWRQEVKIESVASVSCIVVDGDAARRLYRDALQLTFEGGEGDYVFTERLPGVKHMGLWPLREAAVACFGVPEWPAGVPVPQASIEFEVGSAQEVSAAARELEEKGHSLLHDAKEEPWGQTISRVLSPDGLIIGVCYTPWFHDQT
jgi:catechol 2,3-dioxygenase-like lactoylglutathione lyase family enzyme